MTLASCLYFGRVMHRRTRPRSHVLRYRIFSMLFDLDELPEVARRFRWFSHNRFNLFSFYDRDHGPGRPAPRRAHVAASLRPDVAASLRPDVAASLRPDVAASLRPDVVGSMRPEVAAPLRPYAEAPLRPYVEALMRQAGLAPDGGPIRLLCAPRILGVAFNPLSTYFCYRADGTPAAILYEVNNTFGQRHSYLIPVARDAVAPNAAETGAGTPDAVVPNARAPHGGAAVIRQRCAKAFHVSPFMDMAMTYHFRVRPPAKSISVCIQTDDSHGMILFAAFSGDRAELSDRQLLATFWRYPLLAAKVFGGIHWEALKLWRKGMRLRPLPAPPPHRVTVIPAQDMQGPQQTRGLQECLDAVWE